MKYPTKKITVPDVDRCRKQILTWMRVNNVTYRELSERTGIKSSNLNAMLRGNRAMSESLIKVIYTAMYPDQQP